MGQVIWGTPSNSHLCGQKGGAQARNRFAGEQRDCPSSTHTRQVGRLTRLPGPGSGLQAEEQDS